ncbi:MAG: hypothetical protein AB2401_02865 [Bacillus sp. (in: firmicutes)]
MVKNPILQKKYDEGYEKGLKQGIKQSVDFFTEKFKGLEDVPGIGEKTIDKIRKQLGHEYFQKVEKK